MRIARTDRVGLDEFGPLADRWTEARAETITLVPVPVQAVDTSRYVRDAHTEADVGAVEEVTARGVYDGEALAISLRWRDETRNDHVEDSTEFADKAAVAFPLAPGASIMTMGSDRAPLNAWYWRADRSEPYDVIARGLGDTERREGAVSGLRCRAAHGDGRWHVVFTRPVGPSEDEFVDLASTPPGIAFAVWEGQNAERGPLKSYSGEFRNLVIERR